MMNDQKTLILWGFIILLFLLSACGTFEIGVENIAEQGETPIVPSPTVEVESTEEIFEPTLTPVNEDELFIRGALAERLGVEPEDFQFAISQNTGTHIMGNLSNGYFVAVKELGSWQILYDGQSTPYCSDIEPYQVPIDMVPECLDNNILVLRMDDDLLIGEALAAYLDVPLEDLDYLVGQKTARHARGNVSNGYFLAFKGDREWIIAYGGQAYPPCSQIDTYWFPTDMVPECLDENDNLVTRSFGNEIQIGEALASYFEVPFEEFNYTVLQDTGTHAMGHIRGGIFLATKVEKKWLIVHVGHGTPYCAQVDLHNFPSEMVPECVDADNNLVIRTGVVPPPENNLQTLDCGPGSVGANPGTAGYVACNVQDGLLSRNTSALLGYMADPFIIGYWQSEGVMDSPTQMIEVLHGLYNYNDLDYTPRLTFTADRSQFPKLEGVVLEDMFGPEANIVLVVYSEGWGADGQGESLLFFTQNEDGSHSWHGMAYSENNLSP
jgi:hypothetical protein